LFKETEKSFDHRLRLMGRVRILDQHRWVGREKRFDHHWVGKVMKPSLLRLVGKVMSPGHRWVGRERRFDHHWVGKEIKPSLLRLVGKVTSFSHHRQSGTEKILSLQVIN
jgi:hypothetical protein